MEIITIDNINYILGDFILLNAPIYSYRCRSSRELIKTKNIDENKYIYARKINEAWVKSHGKSIKFDKVMIKEDIIKDIPELNNLNQIINNDDGIEKAPNLLHLNNEEKFKDNEDNVLDIEIRGERTHDKIYFKVKDVSKAFIMNHLYKIIIDNDKSYTLNIDYKYFICLTNFEGRSKIKKELFFTLKGLLRLIHVSRNNKFDKNNTYIIKKWLDNFDKTIIDKYNLNIEDIKNSSSFGYIYIVTSELLNSVKIGMWRSSISSLYSRYITYYGNNINIDYFYVNNVRKIEYNIHKYFEKYRISNELFKKEYYNEYIEYIEYIKNNI